MSSCGVTGRMTRAKGSGDRGSRSCRKGVAEKPRRKLGSSRSMVLSHPGATVWWASSIISMWIRKSGGMSAPERVSWAMMVKGWSHSLRDCQTTPGQDSSLGCYLLLGLRYELLPVHQERAPSVLAEHPGGYVRKDDGVVGHGEVGQEVSSVAVQGEPVVICPGPRPER